MLRFTERNHEKHGQIIIGIGKNAQSKNSNIIDLDMSSEIYFINRSRQHRHHPSSTTAIIRIGRRGGSKEEDCLYQTDVVIAPQSKADEQTWDDRSIVPASSMRRNN